MRHLKNANQQELMILDIETREKLEFRVTQDSGLLNRRDGGAIC